MGALGQGGAGETRANWVGGCLGRGSSCASHGFGVGKNTRGSAGWRPFRVEAAGGRGEARARQGGSRTCEPMLGLSLGGNGWSLEGFRYDSV